MEFVFREGDIVSGGAGVRNVEAMQLGSRIHRKIQKSMGVGYESEVPLFTILKSKYFLTSSENSSVTTKFVYIMYLIFP